MGENPKTQAGVLFLKEEFSEIKEKEADMSVDNQMKEAVIGKKEYTMQDVPGQAYGTAMMEKNVKDMKERQATPQSDVHGQDFDNAVSSESAQGSPIQQSTNTKKDKDKKEDMCSQEQPSVRNYANSAERRFNREDKNMQSNNEKKADFDNEAIDTTPAKVEEKAVESKPSEPVQQVNMANPVSNVNIDDLASRLADKLVPQLKPKSMTTHEFSGSAMDPEQETIERLAKKMSIRN